MERSLSQFGGLAVLLGFAATVIMVAVFVARGRRKDLEEFLVADRKMGMLPTAMSIAASWIWAPALFVAAQKTYEQGASGLFWYCVPNFLALVVFGSMALRLRQQLPRGYTFPQFVRERHGKGVHALYLVQFFGLQLGCFAVQLLAGASMMTAVSGMNFYLAAAIITATVLSYATIGGIRASIATDLLQMIVILAVLAITIPWAVAAAGGVGSIAEGIGGTTGKHIFPWDSWVVYSFGIPVSISLLSGPVGDQMHWQRGFVVAENRSVRNAYLLGAVIFIIVPLSLGMLGFLAAAEESRGNLTVHDPQMVGPTVVSKYLPQAMMIIYVIMVLSGLCSTLDSVLCAVSSLAAVDVSGGSITGNYRRAKIGMWVVALCALGIACIPGIKILHLFIIYGSWRASTMVPTYLMLLWEGGQSQKRRLDSRCVFCSIALCLLVAWPVLTLGSLRSDANLTVAGSLAIVAISLLLCLGGSLLCSPPLAPQSPGNESKS